MLTQRELKAIRLLQTWLHDKIERNKDNVINGLEQSGYIKLCAEVRAYREVLKELDAIEKQVRDD